MDVSEAMKALDSAVEQGDAKKLRCLVSELEGREIPLTPLVRMYWSHYWTGVKLVDCGIRMVRPLFPQCGDSQFHPDLTLEEGLKAWNARLVCERIWEEDLTEVQMEDVLDFWRQLLRRGSCLEARELGEILLERYPFLWREAGVEQMLEGQCPSDERPPLSNGSRVALAVRKGKEIRYELS